MYYSVKVSSGAEEDATISRMKSVAYTSALKDKASSITGVPQENIFMTATNPARNKGIPKSDTNQKDESDTSQKDESQMEPWMWILIVLAVLCVVVFFFRSYNGKHGKLSESGDSQRWDMNPVRKSSELVPLQHGGYQPPEHSWG